VFLQDPHARAVLGLGIVKIKIKHTVVMRLVERGLHALHGPKAAAAGPRYRPQSLFFLSRRASRSARVSASYRKRSNSRAPRRRSGGPGFIMAAKGVCNDMGNSEASMLGWRYLIPHPGMIAGLAALPKRIFSGFCSDLFRGTRR
jgi:hypothetical protein